jgi:hypothetical protein
MIVNVTPDVIYNGHEYEVVSVKLVFDLIICNTENTSSDSVFKDHGVVVLFHTFE